MSGQQKPIDRVIVLDRLALYILSSEGSSWQFVCSVSQFYGDVEIMMPKIEGCGTLATGPSRHGRCSEYRQDLACAFCPRLLPRCLLFARSLSRLSIWSWCSLNYTCIHDHCLLLLNCPDTPFHHRRAHLPHVQLAYSGDSLSY